MEKKTDAGIPSLPRSSSPENSANATVPPPPLSGVDKKPPENLSLPRSSSPEISLNPTVQQPPPSGVDNKPPENVLTLGNTSQQQPPENPSPTASLPRSSSPELYPNPRSSSSENASLSEKSGGTPPAGGENHPPEIPFLRRRMSQWEKFVKRCHEVIALLIGFLLLFAPLGFVIKGIRSNGGQVHPVGIIVSILVNLEIHLAYPFVISGLAYAFLYVLSSSDFPVVWILLMDMLNVVAGFAVVFLVIGYIWYLVSIIGGILCAFLLLILFYLQFPRERIGETEAV